MKEEKVIPARAYSNAADMLYERIKTFAETHPEVYNLKSAWGLFDIGFECKDLKPSFYQASWALGKLKSEINE